jgi:hypothetical protein
MKTVAFCAKAGRDKLPSRLLAWILATETRLLFGSRL